MEQKQRFSSTGMLSGKILVASLFILSGILLFARNVGCITDELFSVIVSWHSLFVVLGIYSMFRRHFISGIILVFIGVYFLIGGLSWLPENSQAIVWPVALITVGVVFLLKPQRRRAWEKQHHFHHHGDRMKQGQSEQPGMNFGNSRQQNESVDGFLYSDNTFGNAQHVVLDEIFKGANVRVYFGGTTIDLRHTHLAPGETFIDLDCSCGGIEIYVPSDWAVLFKCDAFFGGCEDKRLQNGITHKESTLVIRGKFSFGGVVIKD